VSSKCRVPETPRHEWFTIVNIVNKVVGHAGGPQLVTKRNGASSQLGYRRRLWKRNPSPNKRGRNGLSLSMLCECSAGARSNSHHLVATIAAQEVGGPPYHTTPYSETA
jgi:hypothetical protein